MKKSTLAILAALAIGAGELKAGELEWQLNRIEQAIQDQAFEERMRERQWQHDQWQAEQVQKSATPIRT